jgi:hypothetical protein
MTNDEAQELIVMLAQLEFPLTFLTSLQFALFKASEYSSITLGLVVNEGVDLWNTYNFQPSTRDEAAESC